MKMGACDTWNVEINILVYENEFQGFNLIIDVKFKFQY